MAEAVHSVDDGLLDLLQPVGAVKKFPGNARVHDLKKIAESLAANRQFRPIIANKQTGHIIKGNGTFTAATEVLGWTHIAVSWVDVDEDTERRMVLVDNRSSELGWFNDSALADLLGTLDGDLVGTGYNDSDLEDLQASLAGDLDLLPPAPEKPGQDMEKAKKKYDLAEMRTLVLVCDPLGYDQLLTDLETVRSPDETHADVVRRLVLAAAPA